MSEKKKLELENYRLRRQLEDYEFYIKFLDDEMNKSYSNKSKVETIEINMKYLKDIMKREK